MTYPYAEDCRVFADLEMALEVDRTHSYMTL